MLALTSPTGKLGSATLTSILHYSLIPPTSLILLTSTPLSSPIFTPYIALGIQIRSLNYDSPSPSSFLGISKLFLVSTPAIEMDFGAEEQREGREKVHIATINAAIEGGVREVVYTSLAFGSKSEAGVMRAHLRTEEYLQSLSEQGKVEYTVLREGLYNESWPLYLGYFSLANSGSGGDERNEIVIAGDGKISWTSIQDLGFGTGLILADGTGKWRGRTVGLSNDREAFGLEEIAGMVGRSRGREVSIRVVSREEYVEYYVGMGRERGAVEWWSSTYEALEKGECDIVDGTLGSLLRGRGVEFKSVRETVREMLG